MLLSSMYIGLPSGAAFIFRNHSEFLQRDLNSVGYDKSIRKRRESAAGLAFLSFNSECLDDPRLFGEP